VKTKVTKSHVTDPLGEGKTRRKLHCAHH